MIKKIDIESAEFQEELIKTKNFTDKVCEKFGFLYNPDEEVNKGIQLGLTRNKLIYGKRYCPCFMVIGQTPEEQKKEDNRVCPCKPALEVEIPEMGHCHCSIFCTPEYVKSVVGEKEEEIQAVHSQGFTKEQCEEILTKEQISAQEVEALLEARDLGFVNFLLVDTREWMEWKARRIKGTDYLIPTTSFYEELEQINAQKDTPIVVYCHSGSRSAYCQKVMLSLGFKSVSNLDYGIITYRGETLMGE